MLEKSAYEGYLDRTGVVCVGMVTSVSDAEAKGRRLRVKTIGSPTGDDLDLPNVRILARSWHVQGDEDVNIPRVGAYGLIIFVKTESFWLGSFPLDATSGENQRANMEKLNTGDICMKTQYGNKIILRTGGTIEILSADLCSLLMTPNNNLIATRCQNWELETSAGSIMFNVDALTSDAITSFKFWNSLDAADTICTLDIGAIPLTNNEDLLTLATQVAEGAGLAIEGGEEEIIIPPLSTELMMDFKVGSIDDNLGIDKRFLRIAVQTDGRFYFDIGPGNFTMNVDPTTGNVEWQTQGSVKGSVVEDVKLSVIGDVAIDAIGAVDIKAEGEVGIEATGEVSVSAKAAVTIDAVAEVSISAKGEVSVDSTGPCSVSSESEVTVSAPMVSISGDAEVTIEGAMTSVGGSGITSVEGTIVTLGGKAGLPVARLGDMIVGVGVGAITGSIMSGSPKVTCG